MNTSRLRQGVRAVVIDTDDRILLVRFDFGGRIVWATPGGGIEDDEADERALRRELVEEAGLAAFELGPQVWHRTHVFELSSAHDGQHERFYLVRTPPFEPSPRLAWEELRDEGMTAVRWWTLDELATADAVFAPRRLPDLVRAIMEHGPPAEPLDAGV